MKKILSIILTIAIILTTVFTANIIFAGTNEDVLKGVQVEFKSISNLMIINRGLLIFALMEPKQNLRFIMQIL